MKKLFIATVIAATALLSGCDSRKSIDGIVYGTYGIANESEMKNPGIHYEISTASVVWAILLSETVVFLVYIIGWDLYEPVGKIDPTWVKGQVK